MRSDDAGQRFDYAEIPFRRVPALRAAAVRYPSRMRTAHLRSPGVRSGLALASLAALGLLAACGGPAATGSPESSRTAQVNVSATFGTGGTAITYSPELVPVGATARVSSETGENSSTVTLAVTGLVPNRTYGSHAHAKACGPAPADSGAHFQHQADPRTPSVDPAYANPGNEVWLDFTTDASGAATITATQEDWAFTEEAAPQSVVIHAGPTATEAGKAGTAGDRLACVSVPF